MLDQLSSIHYRHHHVCYKEIWQGLLQVAQGGGAVMSLANLVTCAFKYQPKHEPHARIVIDDQDLLHAMTPGTRLASRLFGHDEEKRALSGLLTQTTPDEVPTQHTAYGRRAAASIHAPS